MRTDPPSPRLSTVATESGAVGPVPDSAPQTQASDEVRPLRLKPSGRFADLPTELLPLECLQAKEIGFLRTTNWATHAAVTTELGRRQADPLAALMEAHANLEKILRMQRLAPAEESERFEPQIDALGRDIAIAQACVDLATELRQVAKTLAETPDDIEAMEEAAHLLEKCGRFEEAAVVWERKINFSPFSQQDYKSLCRATTRAGHPEKTLSILAAMLEATRQSSFRDEAVNCNFVHEFAEAYLLRGQPQDLQAVQAMNDEWRDAVHDLLARQRSGLVVDLEPYTWEVKAAYYVCIGPVEKAIDALQEFKSSTFYGMGSARCEYLAQELVQSSLVRASPILAEIEHLPAWKAIEDLAKIYPEMALIDVSIPMLSDQEMLARGGRPALDFAAIDPDHWEGGWS